MDENRLRFGVGVLVVAAVAVSIILTFLFGAFPALLSSDVQLTAEFDSAPGVSANTRVLRDGVKIGRVSEIKLRKDGGVQITMEIEREYAPTPAYIPRISMGSFVTGDANLEFVLRDDRELLGFLDGQAGTPPDGRLDPEERKLISLTANDGDFIGKGKVSGDPFKVLVGLEDQVRETLATMRIAGDSVAQASTTVSQLAGSVSEAIGGGGADVRNFTQQTGQAAEQLRKTLAEIEKIVGDPDVQLAIRQTVLKLPEVADNADNTLASITQAADSFQGAGTEAQKMLQDAGQTVQNLEQITRPFADRSESLADSIAVSLEDLDFTLKEVGVFSRRLNEGDGTLRRLLEDDELYWQVKRIVDNVELATVRVRPILDDARVISDKLARDPRQLGLKGALDKRPSGVGLK